MSLISSRIRLGIVALSFELSLGSCYLAGSEGQLSPIPLAFEKALPVLGLSAAPILSPTPCDSSGNIVIRSYTGARVTASPIIFIKKDGSESRALTPNLGASAADRKANSSLVMHDFQLDDSSVYALVSQGNDNTTYLVKLSKQGETQDVIALDRKLNPSRFAVFESGEFVVFGTRFEGERNGNEDYSMVTEFYGRQGQFIKNVTLSDTSDNVADSKRPLLERTGAMDLGLVASDRSSVFVYPASAQNSIYEIAPSGDVTRTVKLSAPKGLSPVHLIATPGELLVEYSEPEGSDGNFLLVSFDRETGEARATYSAPKRDSGVFACYDGKQVFTFLSGDKMGNRTIRTARSR